MTTPPHRQHGTPSQPPPGSAESAAAAPSPAPDAEAITIRRATVDDIPAIVAMLADDHLGALRENPDEPDAYRPAFDRLDADPNQYLVVAEHEGRTVGTLQLTLIPGLSRFGATRAQIEAMRVHSEFRGGGMGARLIEWAAAEARRQGCVLLQLTSDATRVDAHRFYERLGFEASHLGFKLHL